MSGGLLGLAIQTFFLRILPFLSLNNKAKIREKRARCSERGILGARLRGRTATQSSKKGSEKVLGRVLGKGFQKRSEKEAYYWFYSIQGF